MKTFDLGAVTAYAIAVKHGFEGTEAEWIAHLEAQAKKYEDGAKEAEENAAKSAEEAKKAAANAKGVSDWNAPAGEPGHVLNRTHWVEGGMVDILPECVFSTDTTMEILNTPLGLVADEHYIAKLNGVEYSFVPSLKEEDGMQGVAFNTDGSNPEIPFLLMQFPPEVAAQAGVCWVFEPSPDSGIGLPFTLSITHDKSETIHKLPGKYLPDGVPYVEQGEMVEILPETQLSIYNDTTPMADITVPFRLTIGETYIVNLSGVKYKCNCIDGGAYNEDYSGIPGFVNEGADLTTGEGLIFGVLCFPEPVGDCYGLVKFAIKPTEEVTLSIYQKSETIHKLDNRCLDLEWLPTIYEVQIAAEKTVSKGEGNGFSDLNKSMIYEGMPLVIYWDGKRYETEVVNRNYAIFAPVYTNGGAVWLFTLYFYDDNAYFTVSDENSHVASVYTPKVNQLPEEFLPESVATKSYIEEVILGGAW